MNSSTVLTRYLAALMLGAAMLVGGFALIATRAHAQDGSVPPVLSNIASTTTDTGATISWTSDQAGTAQVFYGPTTAYGGTSSFDNGTSSMTHTSFLGGLLPNTMYHFVVVTGNASGTMATSSDMTFMTTNTASTTASSTAPVISAIVETPTSTGATITWTTDQNTNSQIMYGLTSTYGNTTTLDTNNVMSHLEMLTGLTPNTTYHFQVWSTGTGMSGTSTDMMFTTLMASTTGTTGSSTDDMLISVLQGQVSALQSAVATLQAQVAALMMGGSGGNGSTTPPTTGSGTLDQSNITVNAGGSLNFGGRGFPHEENITITLNGSQVAVAHADGGGNFSTGSMSAPTTAGTYTYVFTGSAGGVSNATVTVH